MTTLSIRHMKFTLREMEVNEAQNNAAWYDALPAEEKDNRTHYWHIERKAKNGKKWIFVKPLYATKREAAEIFCKYFRNKSPKFRIRHILAY